ncbi:TPR-like protein, partial [Dendrothele bispora CBS 962.96]
IMFGRDDEKSTLVTTLCKDHAHVIILGAGGIGKTTLALSALCDVEVVKKHPSRHFISCEGIYSVEALLTELANALRIRNRENLRDQVVNLLCHPSNPTILCLDNFETIWTAGAIVSPSPIEQFLSQISTTPMLSIMLTLRGSQIPLNVPWSNNKCILAVRQLDTASSQTLFKNISGVTSIDTYIDKLLKEVDGVPLAIKLLASIVQAGLETTETLWQAWEKERTKMVTHASGNDRLSNLELSIQLSMDSPWMQKDPNAIDALAILSLLPDGLSKGLLDKFQTHLPRDFSLRPSLATLQKVSLAYSNRTTNPERIQLLSPIRHFCLTNLPKREDLVAGLIGFYTEFLNVNWDCTNGMLHKTVPQEMLNLHLVLHDAIKTKQMDAYLMRASIIFTKWSLYIGNPVDDIIQLATNSKGELPLDMWANSLFCLAEVFLRRFKLDEAEGSLNQAVQLYQQAQDVSGEANGLGMLGEVFVRRSKLDEAEASLNQAVQLHRQAQDVPGEANDLQRLGEIFLRRSKLDEAEDSLNRAIKLHQQAQDVAGEAYGLGMLGEIFLRWSKLDEAKDSLHRAMELHRQARDVLGEAIGLVKLGDIFLRQSKLDEAENSLHRAMELHRQARDVPGEASDLEKLGDIFLRQSKLGEAEDSLHRAVQLHRQAQDVSGEATDLRKLGDIFLRQSKLDEAENSLHQAVQLHQQAQDVLGEAHDFGKLGEIFLRRSRLDEAENSLHRAVQLHRQAQDVSGEATDLIKLGDVLLRQSKLDEAEGSLNRAIKLHQQAQDVTGEASGLAMLGDIFLQRSKLDEAKDSLHRAMELHRQARDVPGEATDLGKLGDIFLRQSKLDEAENSLHRAMELHRKARDFPGEAADLGKLGEVFLRRSKLDEAESLLHRALQLHRQAQDVSGEAADLGKLGDI